MHGQPLLWQRVEKKMRPGAAQPTEGTRDCVTMAWIPVIVMFLSHFTGRDRTPQGNWTPLKVTLPEVRILIN